MATHTITRRMATRSQTRPPTQDQEEEETLQQLLPTSISASHRVLDNNEPSVSASTFRVPNPALQGYLDAREEHSDSESIPPRRDLGKRRDPGPPSDRGDNPDNNPGGDPGDDPGDDPAGGPGNPGDEPDPPAPPPAPPIDPEAARLMDIFDQIGQGLRSIKSSHAKLREPDTYDGKDPLKLREFLVSCSLIFMDRPDSFTSDAKKIRFMLSYLRGPALGLFEPYILDPTNSATFMRVLSRFIEKLESNFGPYDPEGDAEVALHKLDMKENHHVNRYIVDFTKYASRLDWNEPALRDKFYRGLPLRLRTEILRSGKPTTLTAMRAKAQECDQAYWLAKDEASKESKPAPKPKDTSKPNNSASYSNSNNSSNRPNNHSDSRPQRSNFTPNSQNSGSGSSSSRPNHSSNNSFKPNNQSRPSPDLSSKLGRDGKLNSDERERRMKNNLCLYCGAPGHNAANCRKSAKAKGRAAQVDTSHPAPTAAIESPPADSKK
jgi:hypothetical protein